MGLLYLLINTILTFYAQYLSVISNFQNIVHKKNSIELCEDMYLHSLRMPWTGEGEPWAGPLLSWSGGEKRVK